MQGRIAMLAGHKRQWLAGNLAVAVLLVAAVAAPQTPPPLNVTTRAAIQSGNSDFFERRIRPLFAARCYSCHSAGSASTKGRLTLDTREAMLKGGTRGPAVDINHPEKSLLLTAISYSDPKLKMPPAGKLSAEEISQLTSWVRTGAPWPGTNLPQPPLKSVPGAVKSAFWAFQPPNVPVLPRVKNGGWIKGPIDRFVLARLEARGLSPAPAADLRTLLRRATFDLTGLPPTPFEIEQFLNDKQPGAFARVVDRLLASPAYGERWGRHWLDVARYADSNGVDENLVYANAWRYRDYVIRAFNQDKPIDRFIREQVAGDLLPSSASEQANTDALIATGYLSLGPKMLAEDDPVKQEEDIIDEQIDTLGKSFLGMTIGCARCHDHKFDPIPQTDYYAMAGIFKSTRTMLNFKNMAEWQERPLVSREVEEKLAQAEREIANRKEARSKLRDEALEKLVKAEQPRAAEYARAVHLLRAAKTHAAELKPVLAKEASPTQTPHPNAAPPFSTQSTVSPPELGGRGAKPSAEEPRSVYPRTPSTGSTQSTSSIQPIVVEAEDFTRGNVLKDTGGFGKGIGVLVNAGKYPNLTEYEVEIPQASAYQLDLRYASGDPRPIRIYINDKLVASNAAGKVTGGFYPDKQAWSAEGVFLLKAGKNLIRFERESYFPHIDKFLLMRHDGSDYPRTREQTASESGLLPEFLAQAEEQAAEQGDAKAAFTPKFAAAPELEHLLPADIRSQLQKAATEIEILEKSKPNPPRAMAVSEGKPINVKVHLRGNYLTLGQECPRGFPSALKSSDSPVVAEGSTGRLELADWLTSPSNPLTARVFVNRVWRWHFGRGIVPSTDNFGSLGDRPSDPALLDWLATRFVKDGWSLKNLHRRIMLSAAYQMSDRYDAHAAQTDPENKLRWRFERRRLEAEEIRDSILAVSGRLDRTMGGTLLKFKDREYVTSTANADPVNYKSARRSVYLPVIRSALYDVFTAFDFGDPTVMNGDRPSTTVAPQALFVMNSGIVLEESLAMARSLIARTDIDDAARVSAAYETCFARKPSAAETKRALDAISQLERAYSSTEPDAAKRRERAWQSLCKSLIGSNEFCYVE